MRWVRSIIWHNISLTSFHCGKLWWETWNASNPVSKADHSKRGHCLSGQGTIKWKQPVNYTSQGAEQGLLSKLWDTSTPPQTLVSLHSLSEQPLLPPHIKGIYLYPQHLHLSYFSISWKNIYVKPVEWPEDCNLLCLPHRYQLERYKIFRTNFSNKLFSL